MLSIEFYLENERIRWSTKIHQLNSDILRRHILPRIYSSHYNLLFSFSEKDSQGCILSGTGTQLGTFKIS
ncbi:hypothetical protein C9I92_01290 [Photobacterium ganghwense]|nr:hypothetical protein C9I92_01290 [Photobacterium ganghwense]